jgi:hypothetical protein
MSLTKTFGVFGAVDETGLNKALMTVFTVRPHYLHYASPPFAASSTVQVTAMSAIPFPLVPGGIPWAVDFTIPTVDLFPANGALPPPLVLNANQLLVSTKARITIGCIRSRGPQDDRHNAVTPLATTFDVVAVGHPVSRFFSPGVGDITFVVDDIVIGNVAPPSLADMLDCLIRMLLNAALSQVNLPFDVIGGGFFKLALEAGPEIADNQIKIWGDVS